MMHSKRPYDDDDEFPFGRHEGVPMKEVPRSYLAMLADQPWIRDWPRVWGYIEKHEDEIESAKEGQRRDRPEPEAFGTFEDYLKDIRGY